MESLLKSVQYFFCIKFNGYWQSSTYGLIEKCCAFLRLSTTLACCN